MINFRLVRHLWQFLAVAEELHFGRAAKRLGMSQPPLTEQIQVLEQALKVKLFIRSRRGTRLTPEGAAILPVVRRLAEQLEGVDLALQEALAGQRGILTIGAVAHALNGTVPDLIQRLRSNSPAVRVVVREIDSAEAVLALVEGRIDLAFARLDEEAGAAVEVRAMSTERLSLAVPAGHGLQSAASVALAELKEEVWVMFQRNLNPGMYDSIIAACHRAGFAPRIEYEVRSIASQLALVGCQQGIALVPASVSGRADQRTLMLSLEEAIEVTTTAVAWHAGRPNPLVQAALRALGLSVETRHG